MASNKDIGKKYQLLDEIEHVLKRPGMYIGSTKPHTGNEWILEDGVYEKYELTYNPGFLKLFDEIISNSVDEHKRSGKINTIKVTTTLDTITIWDNGGIPVVQHPQHKVWIPELIFSNLRAGSNFNDDEGRTVAGTNGVGASLVNIFSKKFVIDTADGKNRLLQTFTNNMANRTLAKISRSSQGFTEITYVPDLARFEMKEINASNWKMMRKRVIDIAAANPGLKLEFNGEKFKFKTFKEYVDLYVKDSIWEKSKDWEFAMGVSKEGYQSISFVNSIQTKDGGTHEAYILNQVIEYLRTMIKKKHKVEVKPSEIKNHLFLFINCTVLNPAFSSQTKEKLITEPKDFGTKHDVTEKFAKAVFTSEVIQSLLDWIEQKKNADERAELRKLNKSLANTKVLKLIDAKGKDRNKCVLGIFEGMSALSAVRKFRDPQNFGAFPLKGKFLNVSEMTNSGVIQNDEVVQLMASLGIKLGEEPKDLRYGKVYIYTDADPDGDSIAALLINFFNKYWPELFDQGRVFKVMTPLVVAKKGKEVKPFYSNEEYSAWEKKSGSKGWDVEYKKGLAALEDVEYRDIIHSPVLVKLQNDKLYKDSLSDWFGSDSEPRKEKLLKLSI
ncbi:GyrB Type IIA topoisomerase (DNA gyrase/topo II, topoisomerase IV), B subunit [uncultured Caudovirales phage]|uniref:DNA topoisomerase 2 n=1 Tax=uncultured Caudovirales phage TaxID=2100421 RepID=A0A6J5SU12_9CAUD|nr:GyrB Type IIA topoisomerase (DNA gyrase/topo II, topoisomerase IV), B subunit [uncultured Caudovirales phage]